MRRQPTGKNGFYVCLTPKFHTNEAAVNKHYCLTGKVHRDCFSKKYLFLSHMMPDSDEG
jgi:hypothetical protein